MKKWINESINALALLLLPVDDTGLQEPVKDHQDFELLHRRDFHDRFDIPLAVDPGQNESLLRREGLRRYFGERYRQLRHGIGFDALPLEVGPDHSLGISDCFEGATLRLFQVLFYLSPAIT